MLKFKTSCALLAYLSSNLLNEVGLSLFRYFEVGLRVCDIVVKKFTFAISSPDEFLSVYALDCYPSSGLLLLNDRRLLYTGERVYRPTKHRSFQATFVAMLLILGGVEVNPEPSSAATTSAANNTANIVRLGVLNVRSAINKISLIHDIIGDHNLDVLVLTKKWFNDTMPFSVTADVASEGYSAVHRYRQNGYWAEV